MQCNIPHFVWWVRRMHYPSQPLWMAQLLATSWAGLICCLQVWRRVIFSDHSCHNSMATVTIVNENALEAELFLVMFRNLPLFQLSSFKWKKKFATEKKNIAESFFSSPQVLNWIELKWKDTERCFGWNLPCRFYSSRGSTDFSSEKKSNSLCRDDKTFFHRPSAAFLGSDLMDIREWKGF